MRDFDIAGALNFNSDQSLCLAELWIRIDENRHDSAIDDVGKSVSVRDNFYLIPVAGFDHGLQVIGTAQSGKQCRLLVWFSGHNLATPGNNATWRTLLIELASVLVLEIEIGLISANVPLGVLPIQVLLLLPPLPLVWSQIRGQRLVNETTWR